MRRSSTPDRRRCPATSIAARWSNCRSTAATGCSCRQWCKGVTANTITDTPGTNRTSAFRVNLDGQEITQETSVAGFGQPGISRDAIAEYQIVTNLFDVTMGRSVGAAGAGDFARRVEQVHRQRVRQLPQRLPECRRRLHPQGAAVLEPTGRRQPGRTDHPATSCITSRPTSISASPTPRCSDRRHTAATRFRCRATCSSTT